MLSCVCVSLRLLENRFRMDSRANKESELALTQKMTAIAIAIDVQLAHTQDTR